LLAPIQTMNMSAQLKLKRVEKDDGEETKTEKDEGE
jgi:hypothetical protein